MLNFLTNAGPYLGYVIIGILSIVGYFSQKRRTLEREDDATATNLITNLRTTVEIQEKTINKMRTDMDDHTVKRDAEIRSLRDDLKHMQGRNSVLEDLFRGNEHSIVSFLKDAPLLISIAKENNEMGKMTSTSVNTMAEALTGLVKHLNSGTTPAPQLVLRPRRERGSRRR